MIASKILPLISKWTFCVEPSKFYAVQRGSANSGRRYQHPYWSVGRSAQQNQFWFLLLLAQHFFKVILLRFIQSHICA